MRSPLAAFFSFAPRRTRPAGRRLQAQRFGVCLEKRPDPLRAGVQVTAEKRDGLCREEPKPPQRPGDCEMRLHCPERHPPGGRNSAEATGTDAQPWAPILSWNEGTDYRTKGPHRNGRYVKPGFTTNRQAQHSSAVALRAYRNQLSDNGSQLGLLFVG